MSFPNTLHRTKTDPGSPDTPSSITAPAGAFVQPDANAVVITFEQATDADPLVQLADNTTTADVTVQISRGGVVALQTPASGHRIARPLTATVPPGWSIYVYLSALTSPNASTQRVNIFLQPYRS